MHSRRPTGPRGFTLVELLVVVAIIALISAIALPTVLPALNERRVSEGSRVLQAILAGTRDAAIRANAPRGIRLLPDPVLNGLAFTNSATGMLEFNPLASNRVVPIEPGPDYTEGLVNAGSTAGYLVIQESGQSNGVPNNPTSWSLNVRQGDKIRFADSGAYYTIAGPVNGYPFLASSGLTNSERVISCFTNNTAVPPLYNQAGWMPEFLYLMNGQDDNGNGWIDEACDGIDNDGDGITDPGFNGLDDNNDGNIDEPAELYIGILGATSGTEYEQEVFVGSQATNPPSNVPYTISRRPVVSPGARETTLPAGVVIDLTTWNNSAAVTQQQIVNGAPIPLPERSRLPVDAFTGYVDIMIDQSGRVIPPGAGMDGGGAYGNSPLASSPFYHFWITEREAVVSPLFGYQSRNVNGSNVTTNIPALNLNFGATGTTQNYVLPMPQGTPNYMAPTNVTNAAGVVTPYLTGERRLLTLFVKTGQISSNSIQNFNGYDTNAPFYDAQSGTKESQ